MARTESHLRAALVAAALVAAAWPAQALAKPAVAFLAFGGGGRGARARRAIMRSISRHYRTVAGQRVINAASALGIRFGKGPNLARAAKRAGVIAVVGGSVRRRRLALAVFSGVDGSVAAKAVIGWRWASRKAVRRARRLVLRALRRIEPADSGGGGSSGGGLTFKPETITRHDGGGSSGGNSGGSGGNTTKPPPVDDGGLSFKPDPINSGGGSSSGGGGQPDGGGVSGGSGDGGDGGTVRKGTATAQHFVPSVGLGIWARVFRFNDHAPNQNRGEYSSGPVFALDLAARLYPLSFFSKGFLANIWMRLDFKIALGLSSRVGQNGNESLSTSLWQILFDLGYRWRFTDKPSSPALDLGFGFGAHSFSIDWQGAQPQLANVSYTFMSIGAGFSWPIVRALASPKTANGPLGGLGLDLRFAYRIVFSAGDIEDPDQWYGPSSTGGINFGLGAVWKYKSLSMRLGYTLTYYFFAFSETSAQRAASGKLTAGGATDTSHTILLGGAYAF